ncbi:MAG: hypothetical protein VKJ46_14860, partial [Leptolyngbyaceae bacterium]|nr:hypothetical protein [Leptolyngbyaceae bacterium]
TKLLPPTKLALREKSVMNRWVSSCCRRNSRFTRVYGGYFVYNWNGSSWVQIDGSVLEIAVQADGSPWVINEFGTVFRRVSKPK